MRAGGSGGPGGDTSPFAQHMARRERRAGDPRRWFTGDGARALEIGLRGGGEPLVGFPLAVGRRLVALERWDREAMAPRGIELIPLLAIEYARAQSPLLCELDALEDRELKRSFFGAHALLRGVGLDSRKAALDGLAQAGKPATVHLDRAAGGASLMGRVRHPGPGVALFETHGFEPAGLALVRLAHVARISFGADAGRTRAGRMPARNAALAPLLDATSAALLERRAAGRAALLVAPLVGQSVRIELSAPSRLVDGRLLAVGTEWFAVDALDERGARRGLEFFALDDVEAVEVANPRPLVEVDPDSAPRLDLDSLPGALRSAQRLWGGVVLELLTEEDAPVAAQILEVGERGVFLDLAPAQPGAPPGGQLWVDLATVISFAQPNRSERDALRRTRKPSR